VSSTDFRAGENFSALAKKEAGDFPASFGKWEIPEFDSPDLSIRAERQGGMAARIRKSD